MELLEVAERKSAIKAEVITELYEAANKIIPKARNDETTYEFVMPDFFLNQGTGESLIYELKVSVLSYLKKEGAIKDYVQSEGTLYDYSVLELGYGSKPYDAVTLSVAFVPNTFLNFLERTKFKGIPVYFDEETGKLKVSEKEILLHRKSLQFKIIQFLYQSPNKMHDYDAIAERVGLYKKEKGKKNYSEYQKDLASRSVVAAQENFVSTAFQPAKNIPANIKKSINDAIDEIRGKLFIKKGRKGDIFECNNGYMLKR